VLTSIGGQNDRWMQVGATPPAVPSKHGHGSSPGVESGGTVTDDLSPARPVTGNSASPLSDNTHTMLTLLSREISQNSPPSAGGARQDHDAIPDKTDGTAATAPSQMTQDAASATSVSNASILASAAQLPTGPAATGSIRNTDTTAPSWRNGWDSPPGASDSWRQQAGLAAYASGDAANRRDVAPAIPQGVTT
jgi:hypothetical protein